MFFLASGIPMLTTSLTLLERVRCRSTNRDGSAFCDNEAWGRLVDLYTPILFRWGLRAGLDETETDDLIQEVFRVLLRKLASFERQRDGSFRKWLQVVTLNQCRERFRRKQLPLANAHNDSDPLSAVADRTALAEFWEDDYRQQLVERAMQIMKSDFSPHVWQACWMHVAQGRPAADVGTELGISANAVRVYSSRVLMSLRAELRELLDD